MKRSYIFFVVVFLIGLQSSLLSVNTTKQIKKNKPFLNYRLWYKTETIKDTLKQQESSQEVVKTLLKDQMNHVALLRCLVSIVKDDLSDAPTYEAQNIINSDLKILLTYMQAHKYDINKRFSTYVESSALLEACRKENLPTIRILLQYGANPWYKRRVRANTIVRTETVLNVAQGTGNNEVTRLIEEAIAAKTLFAKLKHLLYI